MKNPIAIIKHDHREVEYMFKKYKTLGDNALATKQAIVDEIIDAITLHARMEEILLYQKLEELFTKQDKKMVAEAYIEHELIEKLLQDIASSKVGNPEFDANVKVLMEVVIHHVKEEEEKLLPEAEKELSDEEFRAIGKQMEEFKIIHTQNILK